MGAPFTQDQLKLPRTFRGLVASVLKDFGLSQPPIMLGVEASVPAQVFSLLPFLFNGVRLGMSSQSSSKRTVFSPLPTLRPLEQRFDFAGAVDGPCADGVLGLLGTSFFFDPGALKATRRA